MPQAGLSALERTERLPAQRGTFVTAELSIYLDAVRLLAALAVLIGHLEQDGLHADWLVLGRFSHEAVVVFFVLSGLVICHSTVGARGGARDYAIARLARLYSVVLPAIVLSFAVKAAAAAADPILAVEFQQQDLKWSNLLGSLLFLNESWSVGTQVPWNVPFWSLCYEAWYYVLFGLATFMPPGRKRTVALLLVSLTAGPAILLLGPLWAMGAWLSRQGHRWRGLSGHTSLLLLASSVIAFLLIQTSGAPGELQQYFYRTVPGYWRLLSAQRFVTDYVFGLLVVVHFVAARGVLMTWPALVRHAGLIPTAAGFTFSLYLFHRPLTHAAGHFSPNQTEQPLITIGWLVAICIACWGLGSVTEARKQTARGLFTALFAWAGRRLPLRTLPRS